MFHRNSRYLDIETTTAIRSNGNPVSVVKLRRLPDVDGGEVRVDDTMQLDVLAERQYKDPTRFWHIADANTELQAWRILTRARRIFKLPEN